MKKIRQAFEISVNPGQEKEYENRHRPIWPDLEAGLKKQRKTSVACARKLPKIKRRTFMKKIRQAFVMSVNPDQEKEYEKRHRPIWPEPEKIPFGGQVQDGGSVFGFTFYDLMARLRTNGPDDAWKRREEILIWFGEVQPAGGYRSYYTDENAPQRGTLQGGGPPGGLGIDQEFCETLLVPLIMTEGFLGMSVSPDRIRFAPQLPKDWPSLKVGRIQYHDWLLKAKATHDSPTLDLKADLKALPLQVELGPGPWQVEILAAQNQVLHEQTIGKKQQPTVTVDNPASRKFVATRP